MNIYVWSGVSQDCSDEASATVTPTWYVLYFNFLYFLNIFIYLFLVTFHNVHLLMDFILMFKTILVFNVMEQYHIHHIKILLYEIFIINSMHIILQIVLFFFVLY